MANANLSVPEQIRQLNDARKLVLGDVQHYPSVVRGIVPIIKPTSSVELRRWGADFLAEAFATPALPNSEKETMQPYVLELMESMVNNEREDPQVLRSVIMTAASIYPLTVRWTINNSYDTITWERMASIKQRILNIWEYAPPSVRICCIKFAQRVVLAQSVSSGSGYGGALDVSLDKVPPNHQSLNPQTLEAEGMGLLDRMLHVLQESNDALVVDATINCLSILVRTRPGTSSRTMNALLNFDPLKLAISPMSPKTKVMVKSMEKTARILLVHLTKRDPHNPMAPRVQQHVERTMRMVAEALDGSGKKRALENQQPDTADVKRQRISPDDVQIPPLGPGPHTLADIFSLTDAAGLKTFDLSQVPSPLIAKLAVNTLSRIDDQLLEKAIGAVRGRLNTLVSAPPAELNPNTAPLGVDEDDDDYEPDFSMAEDTEQILNKLDGVSRTDEGAMDDALGLKTFSLPQPQEVTPEVALNAGNGIITRVLDMMKSIDDSQSKKLKAGFQRLAATSGVKESWMTILTRLATRSSAGLEEISVKGEDEAPASHPHTLSNSIRDVLYNFIMEDFRKNLDVAVSWLCEEWYNDKIQSKTAGDHPKYYEKCALRLIDGFLPYLHPQDKILTRFLSEIPELNRAILDKVKSMCKDPSVVQLALTSLLYLVMMRPPIKEVALDTVQDIWTEYEESRPIAGKYLSRYRPAFLEQQNEGGSEAPAPTAVAT